MRPATLWRVHSERVPSGYRLCGRLAPCSMHIVESVTLLFFLIAQPGDGHCVVCLRC